MDLATRGYVHAGPETQRGGELSQGTCFPPICNVSSFYSRFTGKHRVAARFSRFVRHFWISVQRLGGDVVPCQAATTGPQHRLNNRRGQTETNAARPVAEPQVPNSEEKTWLEQFSTAQNSVPLEPYLASCEERLRPLLLVVDDIIPQLP